MGGGSSSTAWNWPRSPHPRLICDSRSYAVHVAEGKRVENHWPREQNLNSVQRRRPFLVSHFLPTFPTLSSSTSFVHSTHNPTDHLCSPNTLCSSLLCICTAMTSHSRHSLDQQFSNCGLWTSVGLCNPFRGSVQPKLFFI